MRLRCGTEHQAAFQGYILAVKVWLAGRRIIILAVTVWPTGRRIIILAVTVWPRGRRLYTGSNGVA